ncbi:MAG: hypothetical protein AAB316_25590 [Bacteroidota bacterium]
MIIKVDRIDGVDEVDFATKSTSSTPSSLSTSKKLRLKIATPMLKKIPCLTFAGNSEKALPFHRFSTITY